MYKLLTSIEGSDDLCIGFDRDQKRRRGELTNDKKMKGVYLVTIMLNDVLGFALDQEKATAGLE